MFNQKKIKIMHSKIFQVGLKPISEDNYVQPDYFYEGSESFADWIGDEMTDNDREECIEWLEKGLESLFDLNKEEDALVFKGMGTFITEWNNAIKNAANKLQDGVYDRSLLFKIKDIKECTHLRCDYRFFIEDYNGCAGSAQDLIEFAYNELKPGDKLYIGNVIDFHY